MQQMAIIPCSRSPCLAFKLYKTNLAILMAFEFVGGATGGNSTSSKLPAAAGIGTYDTVVQANMAKAFGCGTVMTTLVISMATIMWLIMMRQNPLPDNDASPKSSRWGERPAISPNATCDDWNAWVPPASDPAVVMQVWMSAVAVALSVKNRS